MKRVCKKDGLILLLNMGMPEKKMSQFYFRMNLPLYLLQYGFFPHRPWDKIVDSVEGFEVIQRKRLFDGGVYYQILRNKK